MYAFPPKPHGPQKPRPKSSSDAKKDGLTGRAPRSHGEGPGLRRRVGRLPYAAGNRPISEVLGELASREVDRYRSKRLRQGQLEPGELVDALEDARRQQQDLALIVERLERLHQPR